MPSEGMIPEKINGDPVLEQCVGVIDCGATASLGSAEALETIAVANLKSEANSNIVIDTSKRPTSRFRDL